MESKKELMQIGKLTLVEETWDWGSVLKFEHIEYQPAPYSDDEVETEIIYEQAIELRDHLQAFIDKLEKFE